MDLKDEVRAQHKKYEDLRLLNRDISIRLGLSGILLSLLATIVGLFGDLTLGIPKENEPPHIVWLREFTPWAPKIAATLAAISGGLQAILFAYPVSSRAIFYAKIVATLKNIELDLVYNSLSENELAKLEEFKKTLIAAANEEPQDENIDPQVIKKIQEAIDTIKIQRPPIQPSDQGSSVGPGGDRSPNVPFGESVSCGTRTGIEDELESSDNLCGTRNAIPIT
jgi:hypothetical protein